MLTSLTTYRANGRQAANYNLTTPVNADHFQRQALTKAEDANTPACSQAARVLLISRCTAAPATGLTFQLRYHVSSISSNPRMTRTLLKSLLHAAGLKEKPLHSCVATRLRSDRRVKPKLSQSCVSDPLALGAALALDATFNLWICGNREDFLSTDPLAPSVHNPVPFSHTARLTRREESPDSGGTHTWPVALTHIPSPEAFVQQAVHWAAQPGHCCHNQCTRYLTLYPNLLLYCLKMM